MNKILARAGLMYDSQANLAAPIFKFKQGITTDVVDRHHAVKIRQYYQDIYVEDTIVINQKVVGGTEKFFIGRNGDWFQFDMFYGWDGSYYTVYIYPICANANIEAELVYSTAPGFIQGISYDKYAYYRTMLPNYGEIQPLKRENKFKTIANNNGSAKTYTKIFEIHSLRQNVQGDFAFEICNVQPNGVRIYAKIILTYNQTAYNPNTWTVTWSTLSSNANFTSSNVSIAASNCGDHLGVYIDFKMQLYQYMIIPLWDSCSQNSHYIKPLSNQAILSTTDYANQGTEVSRII
jgi:hypothetical protein